MSNSEGNYPPTTPMQTYLTCVGRIAIGWAYFEAHLNKAIWELANVEQYAGACITSQFIGPGPRFRAILALMEFRKTPEATIKTFRKLMEEAEKLSRQRNRFVHDPAAVASSGDYVRMEITADRKLSFGMEHVTIEDFRILEEKIRGIIRHFNEAFVQALVETPPYANLQFGQSPGYHITVPPEDWM